MGSTGKTVGVSRLSMTSKRGLKKDMRGCPYREDSKKLEGGEPSTLDGILFYTHHLMAGLNSCQ